MFTSEVQASATPRASDRTHVPSFRAPNTVHQDAAVTAGETPAQVDAEDPSQEVQLPDTPSLSQSQTQREDDSTRLSQRGWGTLIYNNRKGDASVTIPIEHEEFIVGRGSASDFDIATLECSKIHFIIRNQRNEKGQFIGPCTIEDRSTNGTWVNHAKMLKNKIQPLRHGDSIYVRSTHEFLFRSLKVTSIEDELFEKDSEFGIVSREFSFHDKIGSGSYATVYSVTCREKNDIYACKIIRRSKARLGKTILSGNQAELKIPEVRALQSGSSHRNIIRFNKAFYTKENIYIVMELVRGGELFEYLRNRGRLPEKEAIYIVYQILMALMYLHAKNVTHRDIKPENILMDEAMPYSRVVLGDFGLAKQAQSRVQLKTLCGTLHYIAPEILLVGTADGEPTYNSAVDIYALGVMTFFLVSGFLPFEGNSDTELTRSILKGRPNYRKSLFDWSTLSPNCISFIQQLMHHTESRRPTAEECFKHPWLADNLAWLNDMYREI